VPRSEGLVALVLSLAVGAIAGCQGPCTTLAEQICACEPNRALENSCLQTVRAAMNQREVSVAEAAVCEQKLDTCTCEALEDGDLVACGLAKAP
jgi:hypothetical protein